MLTRIKGLMFVIYAALGDSITYGYLATTADKQFVSQVHSRLRRNRRVSLYMVAKPGWSSGQLLKSVKNTPKCIWDESGIITIMVGGNDLLRASPWILNGMASKTLHIADRLGQNLAEIVRIVKRPYVKILVATIYNPFPNSLVAEECTKVLNSSVRLVVSRENLVFVDVHKAFKWKEHRLIEGYNNGQISDLKFRKNPIHPNDLGHKRIAQLFFSAYQKANIIKVKARNRGRINTR